MRHILLVFALASLGTAQQLASMAPPLTATVSQVDTTFGPAGAKHTRTAIGRFIRDSQGRTRMEWGDSVVISDPQAGQVTTLDLKAQAAHVVKANSIPRGTNNIGSKMLAQSNHGAIRLPLAAIGTRIIGGFETNGFRSEFVVPPGRAGNILPLKVVSEMWRSVSLRMPILVKTIESRIDGSGDILQREHTEAYSDLSVGQVPNPSLFSVPAGFRLIE